MVQRRHFYTNRWKCFFCAGSRSFEWRIQSPCSASAGKEEGYWCYQVRKEFCRTLNILRFSWSKPMVLNMLANRIIIRVTCISPIPSTPIFVLCFNLKHFDTGTLDLLLMKQSNNKTRRPSVCKTRLLSIHHRNEQPKHSIKCMWFLQYGLL